MAARRGGFAALSAAMVMAATPVHGQEAAPAAPAPATDVAPVIVVAPRQDTSDAAACERVVRGDPILRAWGAIMRDPNPFPPGFSEGGAGASLAVPGPTRYRATRLPRDPVLNLPPKTPPGSAMPEIKPVRVAAPIRTTQGPDDMRADGGPDEMEKAILDCRTRGGQLGPNPSSRRSAREPGPMALAWALFDDRRFEEALEQFKLAEKTLKERNGGGEAALMIGKIYLTALGDKNDPVLAVKWLKKAATGFFDPMGTMPKFDPRAPDRNTELGEASMLLGRLYLKGAGPIEKDPREARKWFERAFTVGHVAAAKAVGDLHYFGVEGEPNMKAALAWYSRGARFGHAPSQFALARMYETGEAGKVDLKTAVAWYNEAAKIEYPAALYALGYAYDKGIGVSRDPVRAIGLYKTAAIKGDVGAQAMIATCFYTGDQVEKNLPQARQWFEAAARGGDADAAFSLAAMMSRGEGGELDRVKAWSWLHVAQIEQHPKAADALTALERKMTPDERKAAAALVGASG